jgi:hypothetical protein
VGLSQNHKKNRKQFSQKCKNVARAGERHKARTRRAANLIFQPTNPPLHHTHSNSALDNVYLQTYPSHRRTHHHGQNRILRSRR